MEPDDYSMKSTYITAGSPYNINTSPIPDIATILKKLEAIEKRLGIIESAPKDKSKALQAAYEHYKFLEKLCEGEANGLDTGE